ncbi:MAG: DUF2804 domain-containing protein [Spirochaetes bacterium]|nr:DUF2804 domain-containing protein [Spirochaetota bacterium]MBU1079803.1 DUF2804 domain-containing protein [Spirochaetota bacterium]
MAGEPGQQDRPRYSRTLADPPRSVVLDGEFILGCFNAPPELANMLDVRNPYHYPVPRWVKDFRCKEWKAFQFGDKRWFFFTALYEAKSFGLTQFTAWDREKGRCYETKRLIPFASFGIGDRLDGERPGYRDRRSAVRYSFDLTGGSILVEASRAKSAWGKPFSGSFSFAYNARQTAPSSVCLPLGLNRAMYSTKVLMPMQGWFEADGERFEFGSPDAMGILDDHKGFYPYAMRYDWVTGYGQDSKGRRVGFNLTDNQVRDPSAYNENVLWINSRVFPLPPIKVTRPNGPEKPWHIQDTEGLVDLTFKPERKNDMKLNLLLAAIDYHGPFGSFEGTLRSADGAEKVDAQGLFGMGEEKYLRA